MPQASAPVFSPAVGTFNAAQSVTLTDAAKGAVIYYTLTGKAPTTASTKYMSAIMVSQTTMIEAIAVAPNYINSVVATGTYTITLPAATPAFSLKTGTYAECKSVSIADGTSNATMYFTTDGTTPTSKSTAYTGAIPVSTTETIKVIAFANGFSQSAVASATYTIAAAPTATTVSTS